MRTLIETFAQAEALRGGDFGPWNDGWCRSTSSGHRNTNDLHGDQLSDLARMGCRIEVEIDADRFRLTAMAERSAQFTIDASGEWTDVTDDEDAARIAAEAATVGDLARLIAAVRSVPAAVTITVFGADAELAWVRTSRALRDEFERSGWLGFASLLAPEPPGPKRVIVLDAGGTSVRSPGLLVHGPDTWPDAEAWQDPGVAFSRRFVDVRVGIPSPAGFLPRISDVELREIDEVLRSTAGALAWLWLADQAKVDNQTATIGFQGNRPLLTVLPRAPVEEAKASVALWRWVVADNQPGRRAAAAIAITLQADNADDLFARAGAILDTAEFLFSVAQSGLVQEALAARRAARDSAVAAARSAADRSRSTARSAVDRALVVIGGGLGIVLASKGNLIDRPLAYALLCIVAALVVGGAVLAFHFELPGANAALDAFGRDLDQQTDVLAPRDIRAIRVLPSLVDARSELGRARRAIWTIAGLALLALLGLAIVLALGGSATRGGARTPPTTTTTSV